MIRNKLMTHFIAGYPTMSESKDIALAMIEGGCVYLEIQFPFSDPIADGPIIEEACAVAIKNGFTIEEGFDLVNTISLSTTIPLFIMTYANLLMCTGIHNFVQKSVDASVTGLIVPDLPYDYDEGLSQYCEKYQIACVPVIVQDMAPNRLLTILQLKPEYVYCAIRKGITGKLSEINQKTIDFMHIISRSGSKIMAGFGIRSKEQVDLLSDHVESVVVGSALVNIIRLAIEKGESPGDSLKKFISTLL